MNDGLLLARAGRVRLEWFDVRVRSCCSFGESMSRPGVARGGSTKALSGHHDEAASMHRTQQAFRNYVKGAARDGRIGGILHSLER